MGRPLSVIQLCKVEPPCPSAIWPSLVQNSGAEMGLSLQHYHCRVAGELSFQHHCSGVARSTAGLNTRATSRHHHRS